MAILGSALLDCPVRASEDEVAEGVTENFRERLGSPMTIV